MCIHIVDGNHAQFSSAIDRLERTCDDYVHGLHKRGSDQPASVVADQELVISYLRNQIADLMKDKEASVSASTQILGALDRAGLRQYDGSLADNVADVIKLCAERRKEIESLKKRIEANVSVITTLTARLDTINATVNGMKDLC